MSEYRIRSTGEVKTQGEIRKIHSNMSLPRVWDSNVCDALGIDPVLEAPKPETTGYTQAIRNGVVQDAKGNWVQAWSVVDMFSDYTDDEGVTHTKAEQEAEYQARLDAEAAKVAQETSKLEGIEISGVMCSATKDDQNGLTAIAMAVTLARMAGQVFPDTVFTFSNGNQMTITDANFDATYSVWVPFRQSFFVA